MNIFKKRNGINNYIKQKEELCVLLREAYKNKECFDTAGNSLGECQTLFVPQEYVESLAIYLIHHKVRVNIK